MSNLSMSLQAAMCHSVGGGSFSNVISGAISLSEFVWKGKEMIIELYWMNLTNFTDAMGVQNCNEHIANATEIDSQITIPLQAWFQC